MPQQTAFKEVTRFEEKIKKLALDIWNNPEGPYAEKKASEWTAELLREAGFEVEVGVGGIKTAIRASFGSGKPVLALLGEYDALPGMSQKVSTEKEPVVEGAFGHACGHNLLGAAHVGAAIGIKKAMEEKKLPGTVVFFGCPAEEVLSGKAFMARAGVFDGIDFSVSYHPGNFNYIGHGRMTGLNAFKLHFKGRSAHAGGDPHNGRSALDALELTHIGINYLREHVPTTVRMHYVITDGGVAPNIVPDRASGWYFVRAQDREMVDEVYARMLDVAHGAARMTGTEVDVEFLGACYPTLSNKVLAEVMQESLLTVEREPWTEAEIEFAKTLNGDAKQAEPLHTGVLPLEAIDNFGSTDVGDVQHIAPGVMFYTASWNTAAPGHNWHIASCAGHSIGLKGMLHGARVMADFGIKVMSNPEILSAAKKEFLEKTKGKPYVCPIPDEVPIPGQD